MRSPSAQVAAFSPSLAVRPPCDPNRVAAAEAKAAGALHHRFGIDDSGLVIILDEWETATAFQKFFDNPTIASLMQDSGVTEPRR